MALTAKGMDLQKEVVYLTGDVHGVGQRRQSINAKALTGIFPVNWLKPGDVVYRPVEPNAAGQNCWENPKPNHCRQWRQGEWSYSYWRCTYKISLRSGAPSWLELLLAGCGIKGWEVRVPLAIAALVEAAGLAQPENLPHRDGDIEPDRDRDGMIPTRALTPPESQS